MTTRAIAYAAIICAIAAFAVAMCSPASAAQCGCPPTPEPPVVVSPLQTPEPPVWSGAPRVWLPVLGIAIEGE